MIDRDTVSFETETPRVERADVYSYAKATEGDDPDFALRARRVHAVSYKGEGFIGEAAITETGEVDASLDKARGDGVEYYLGFDDIGTDVSTIRKVDASQRGGFELLPGYGLCADSISDEQKALFAQFEQQGRPINEISAFGHIPEVTSAAGVETLRHILQEALGTDEIWFFSMVTPKLRSLQYMFGPHAIRSIGKPIQIDDERTAGVTLTPAYLDTTTFFDDVQEAIANEPDAKNRSRYLKYLKYFTEGVPLEKMSSSVKNLIGAEQSLDLTTYMKAKTEQTPRKDWEPPQQFSLKNPADALYVRQLIDGGVTVVDPAWSETSTEAAAQEGKWFYYPWNNSLVHFPDEQQHRSLVHTRDRQLVTEEEQTVLYDKEALYAGMSVGSHVFEHMVRAGVGGSHVLADFDTVSLSNLNRVRVGMAQVGERKVDAFAKKASELDPYLQLTLLQNGVTEESLAGLSKVPDIIFDEVDDFSAKALLRMYAKENGVPLIMATDVGYKSIVDIERHDLQDVQPFNGRLSQRTIEAMLRDELTPAERMKITTRLIGLSNASFRLLQSVSDPSLEGFPQLDVTASQGGALATIVARDILLGRDVSSGRHVHDARRDMKLPSEMPLKDGFTIVKNFLAKR